MMARPKGKLSLSIERLEERYMFSVNPIVAENELPGTPESVWDVPDPSSNIEGFAVQFSVDVGQTVQFKVNTDASAYHLDIYRIGYYQGDGGASSRRSNRRPRARKISRIRISISRPIRPTRAIGASPPRGMYRPRPCRAFTSLT